MKRPSFLIGATVFLASILAAAESSLAESRSIDVERSSLTVFVYKSGLFSAFADNHTIRAPLSQGSISDEPPGIAIKIRTAAMRVLDPDMSADKRADVQMRMEGPEVLDVAKFPEITFESTAVEPAGNDRWTVTGHLTVKGRSKAITFPVALAAGVYRGEVTIKQRDFGIEPIKVAGGTVRVKDELKVRFEIAK